MITKESTFKEALEIKSAVLNEKKRNYYLTLASAYENYPRLKEIENKQAALGSELALISLSGDMAKVENIKKETKVLSLEKKVLLDKARVEEINYDCSLCRDTGYYNGKICDCVKNIAKNIMLKKLSSSMPLKESSFENFDLSFYKDSGSDSPRRRMSTIFNLCKEYVNKFSPYTSANLLFMGQAGLGKTHLTLAIVSGVIEKGYMPVYGSAENLFSQVEKEKFTGENRGAYESMIESDLLVIDDLGAEISTSVSKSILYNLINSRLLSKRPVIINTNLTMKELEQRYTARITSRLIGEFDSNKFLGEDIRQQKIIKR